MSTSTAVAIVLAALSTTITSLAYLREHDAAAALPVLSMRRPLHSIRLLLGDRSWLLGFVMESSGFLLYAAALALAPLSLVQSINAGGIGVLAYVSARMARRELGRRELAGVILSVLGLLALAVSLVGGSGAGGHGSTALILVWLGASAAAADTFALGTTIATLPDPYGTRASSSTSSPLRWCRCSRCSARSFPSSGARSSPGSSRW